MKIFNKKASFEYQLENEKLETGIVLNGIDAKAFRDGRINLNNAYIKIMHGEMFLINAVMGLNNQKQTEASRIRKLLLHKAEILSLETKIKQKKLQIVPISMYNKGRKIKLLISLGKSKRKFQKKESIKKKDIERDIEREFKI